MEKCSKDRKLKVNLNIIQALRRIVESKIPKNYDEVNILLEEWNNYQVISFSKLQKHMDRSQFDPDYSIRSSFRSMCSIDQIDREIVMESKKIADSPDYGESIIVTWDNGLIECVKRLKIPKLFADRPEKCLGLN